MIKALWFALRIGLLVAAAVWIADQPGQVEVVWQDYTARIDLGFFLLILISAILLAIFLYSTIKTFIDFPKSFGRYNEIKRREKGYEALTIGLTAVAAGDTKKALSQAKKTTKYLPGDTGLPLLLEAQAARLDGREDDAAQSFSALLEDKNASFLGLRGLLQNALDRDDPHQAIKLAETALDLQPRQPWILKIVYDLNIRLRRWRAALGLLDSLQKYNAMTREQVRKDHLALLMVLAQSDVADGFEKDARDKWGKALKLDAGFVPAALRQAQSYGGEGYKRKAQNVIKSAWKENPHPQLAEGWMDLMPKTKARDALARLRWLEKLTLEKELSYEGALALTQGALQAELWGEARAFLDKVQPHEIDARYYHLSASLEKLAHRNIELALEIEQRAERALPEPAWRCSKTGRIYDQWMPIAPPHGSFNTIFWGRAAENMPLLVLEERADISGDMMVLPKTA